jgi:hypothetical protein
MAGHPNGSKPPNPKYVPKQHGRMPKASGHHKSSGKFDNASGCAVTAFGMLAGIVAVVVAAGYGIVEAIV